MVTRHFSEIEVLLLQTNYVTFATLPGNNDIITRCDKTLGMRIKLAWHPPPPLLHRRAATHLRV